ncbi:alpha/beta hydrolase family protein [Sphingobacterium wenxiniae]|uniref:Serine aminopeptidase S33 domain-containing protein n=1 Tax=Sphingobacterium wenxiniae TaxID=683125 RepID=A0A1I6R262_9SPHI|nr:alpha/beta hydrolase [Sphingobacterium wenxiniae]SFS58799.1 hypothetical protein SAMN05660206_10334 [Sphingobacterium wenxiniae]
MRNYLVFILLLVQSCLGYSQSFEGTWRGDLKIQGMALPLVFHLQGETKEWKGSMESPAQSKAQIPLSSVRVEQDSIFIEVAAIGLRFQGRLLDNEKLEGQVLQNGMKLPIVMSRPENVSNKRLRPQTPTAPYPYDTLDVRFKNTFDAEELAGTITMPRSEGKFPAVVLVTGSGPQDRNSEIFGHQIFKVVADYLTRNNIIVLRYDERGIGQSKGNYTTSTINEFSKDVISAVDFLKSQEKVDVNRVGIIGHSEGGLIATLIAGQHSADIDFIGVLAGPAISIDSLMVLQAYEIGKNAGMSENYLEQVRNINRKNYALVKSDLSAEHAYLQILENTEVIIPDPTQSQKDEIKMMMRPAYRYFMRIDPVPFIQQIKIPVYAAFGGKDIQVPFAPNMESLSDNLPKNDRHLLKVYDGLNHLFQKAETGAVSEYVEIEETFNEVVLSDLAGWINSL